jgi:lipoate-protein ligase A
MAETLRVIDGGSVSALRSQSLWHGIASAMRSEDPLTLSFCQPNEPYVCLGFHRQLGEVDLDSCRRLELPIIRRQIGGGPVLIDDDQLFFQITMPAARAPLRVDRLYGRLLAPAVEAFQSLGVDARLRGVNEIAIGDRRLSGTGAGRIGEAVTVVGNIIFRFDHERMSEVLALPSDSMRSECARLMGKHVASLYGHRLATASLIEAKSAWVEAYRAALATDVEYGSTTAEERREIAAWEDRFCRPEWLAGPSCTKRPGRQVKVWAGAWVFENSSEGLTVQATVVDGCLERVAVTSKQLNGVGEAISEALVGRPADNSTINKSLAPFGADGRQVAHLLGPGLDLH